MVRARLSMVYASAICMVYCWGSRLMKAVMARILGLTATSVTGGPLTLRWEVACAEAGGEATKVAKARKTGAAAVSRRRMGFSKLGNIMFPRPRLFCERRIHNDSHKAR